MAADTYPDSWRGYYLISLIAEGNAAVSFAGITSEISEMNFVEKPMDTVELATGGHVVTHQATTKESISFKVYPVSTLVDGTGAAQLMHRQSTDLSVDPIEVLNTNARKRFGIVMLWAKTLPATAVTVPSADVAAHRIMIVNAYMTKYKPSYDDKNWTAEITFEWAPFQKDATANKIEESTISTVLQAAITTATTMV